MKFENLGNTNESKNIKTIAKATIDKAYNKIKDKLSSGAIDQDVIKDKIKDKLKKQIQKTFKMRKGFTLIELLVVVAIIGILAAVGVVAYNGYTKSAKISVVKTNHNTVKNYIINEINKCYNLDVEFDSITINLIKQIQVLTVLQIVTVIR